MSLQDKLIHSQKKQMSRQKMLLTDNTPFAMQEAYKLLRTNVLFSLPGSGCKCVGVTSPCPGDGKSTTAANLALSLAQIGKRVLLVDCDMRLPTVASSFRIPLAPGLSDFLVGQAKIEDCVRQTSLPGISLVPAGNIPPDPTGLLEARQIEHLFTAFRTICDFVIVDLPPVTSVPDAVILSKYLDGYLLVVRQKRTRHRDVVKMLKQLELADSKLLGFTTIGGGQPKKYYSYKRKNG